MSESERMDQLSGGGEDDEDDVVAVSSLRRRRRLSSAALGSPSSSPTTTPSSGSSCLSVSEAADVESAGWEETVACSAGNEGEKNRIRVQGFWFKHLHCLHGWHELSVYLQLAESVAWLVLLPAAADEAVWFVPLASARGGLWRRTTFRL